MRRFISKAMIATAAWVLSAPAQAAMVTQSFAFSAAAFFDISSFDPANSTLHAPIDPVVGRVTFQYDNTDDTEATSSGLLLSGFNLPYVGTAKFIYRKFSDSIDIGTDVSSSGAGISGQSQFILSFFDVSTNPTTEILYTHAGSGLFISTQSTVTPLFSAVPEPASWALMIVGFGVIGGAIRRRNRQPNTLRIAYS